MSEVSLNKIPQDDLLTFEEWQKKVVDYNINVKTLLATDYTNHFNEVVMMIEMLPDMVDMIEDCNLWTPKTYEQHFVDVDFPNYEIVIEAYQHIKKTLKVSFEQTISQINHVTLTGIGEIDKRIIEGDDELIRHQCKVVHETLQKLMVVLNGLIHGSNTTMDQSEIDNLIAGF